MAKSMKQKENNPIEDINNIGNIGNIGNIAEIGIIVTRPKGQSHSFIQKLQASGYTAFDLPGIIIAPPQELAKAQKELDQVSEYDYLLFTSPNSVRFAKKLGLSFDKIKGFISIGSGTERALEPYLANKESITAPKPYTSEALVETLKAHHIAGKKILIISGEGGRRLLDQAIDDLDGFGKYCDVYRREAPTEEMLNLTPLLSFKDASSATTSASTPTSTRSLYLVISSQEAFNNLLPILERHQLRAQIDGIFVGSERLENIVKSEGFERVIVARSALEKDLWQAIEEYFNPLTSHPLNSPSISPDNDKERSMTQELNNQDSKKTEQSISPQSSTNEATTVDKELDTATVEQRDNDDKAQTTNSKRQNQKGNKKRGNGRRENQNQAVEKESSKKKSDEERSNKEADNEKEVSKTTNTQETNQEIKQKIESPHDLEKTSLSAQEEKGQENQKRKEQDSVNDSTTKTVDEKSLERAEDHNMNNEAHSENVATSATTATTSSTEHSTRPSQGLTYLALILALGGLGLGGFSYYKGSLEKTDKIAQLESAIATDASTISTLKGQVDTLNKSLSTLKVTTDKIAASDAQSLSGQVAAVAQKHDQLNQSMAESAKGLQAQIDKLATTQKDLLAQGDQINNIAKVSNQAITIANSFDKKLAAQELQQNVVLNEAKELISTIKNITDLEMLRTTEVDYLLKVAIQKVQYDKDYKTASQILSSALDKLSQINSINFNETKKLLEANIDTLKTLEPLDLVDITRRLEKVTILLQKAPLKSDSALVNLKNEIFNQGAPEGESWTDKLTSSLKHLVVIEDKRTEVPELMAKEDRFFLLQNIQLELTAAKIALLQDQVTLFKHSVESVQSWVKTYFDEDNADVREAIQQLQWLLDAKLEVTPPNIERTLTDFEATLRAYKGAQ